MKLFRISLLLAASLVLVGAVAACGDDDDDDDDDGGEEPAATTPAGDGNGGATNAVSVSGQDFLFLPDSFTVTAGEEVTITLNNSGNAPHTLTVYTDEEYQNAVADADTGTISGGDSGEFAVTFEAGPYYFRCEIHPSLMQGQFEAE